MGSYDMYDYAYDNRFRIPSTSPSVAFEEDSLHETREDLQEREMRFGEASPEVKERYAQWCSSQNQRWRDRLPLKIERPVVSWDSKTMDQLQSRLFRMPLEVREMIYGYIFEGGMVRLDVQEKIDGQVVRDSVKPYKLRNLEPQHHFAILQACKKT